MRWFPRTLSYTGTGGPTMRLEQLPEVLAIIQRGV
jgi:hypothetical protein